MLEITERIQLAAILAGIFVCLWGLSVFGHCLVRVLKGQFDNVGFEDKCTWHAGWAMVCITGIFFSLIRASAMGFIPAGPVSIGMLFVGGETMFMLTVGMAIWATARDKAHVQVLHVKLSHVFRAVFIISGAFTIVSMLRPI